MSHTPEFISKLLICHLDGSITAEEREVLNNWMAANPENRGIAEEWMAGNKLKMRVQCVVSKPNVWATVAKHLENSKSHSRNTRRVIGRFVRIAAVFIGIAAVTLLWWRSRELPGKCTVVATNKLQPGSSKATLTLANGKIIKLDSSSSGSVSDENGITVFDLSAGMLAYRQGSGKNDAATGLNTLSTPNGGQYRILLPDGSKVWLNSASSLKFPVAFTGSDRSVQLTGEAYFDIAPIRSKPFSVAVNGIDVQVLGTEFNIMAYPEEGPVKTTLINGGVRVSGHTAGVASSLTLQPGQQAMLQDSWLISTPDLKEVLAWKEGEFRFKNTPIKVIMRQFARWYDMEVSYEGAVPDFGFTGVISKKQYPDQLLESLEASGEVHFQIKGNKVIVRR